MGPTRACDAVFTAYAQSLIKFKSRQLSRKPGFNRSDEEDVAQELTTHLLTQAHRFDPSRASADTFADRVIQSKIAMILRDRRRLKRAAGFSAQSLEQPTDVRDHGAASLRDVLGTADLNRRTGAGDDGERRAAIIAAVVEAVRSLPPDLQDVCRRLIDRPTAAVARDLGTSRRQLRNAIESVRSHFEAAGLGDS